MIVKTGGTDRELGAVILGRRYGTGTLTCYEAAQRILREIDGWPRATSSQSYNYGASGYGDHGTYGAPYVSSMDSQGVFLPNGGCAYIDMGHPEICTPECRSAQAYVGSLQAMIAIVQDAMRQANARLPDDEELALYVDNTDRQGNSYGAHLNVTVSRRLWDHTFRSRLFPYLVFLASFQASSIVLTGGGKAGSEDGMQPVDYQLSRRADFIKTYVAERTTYDRPMVNSRDEALGEEARLHCIFWDAVLFPGANYLQFGCLQLITALMEAGIEWMPERLLLESPIEALHGWSRDVTLTATARLLDGKRVTALEHQALLLEQVQRFVDTGRCNEAVTDAPALVGYWAQTLGFLQRGDHDRAARRIEWLAKWRILENAVACNHDLDWRSLEIRQLDLCFSDLNPDRSLFFALAANKRVDRIATEAEVAHYQRNPPEDTRALARTSLVRQFSDRDIVSVDWSEVCVRHGDKTYRISLPSPDQPVVALNDLTAELLEQTSRRHQSIQPYIGY